MDIHYPQGAPLVATSSFDAWQLLGSSRVARVAWYDGARVSLVPVACVVADGALWFRTSPSAALVRAGAGVEVAVEADHVDPAGGGWSVVLRAAVELVDPDRAPDLVTERCGWPEGDRTVYVRLVPSEVSGRRLQGRAPR